MRVISQMRNDKLHARYESANPSYFICHWSLVKPFSARLFACLLAASGFFLSACSEREAPPQSKPVVPVVVAAAVLKDVPVQLNAIGTVEAYSTVTVKTQVSGEL